MSGLIDNEFVIIIIGLSIALGAFSLFLTNCVVSDLKVKRYAEIAFSAVSLGTVIYGYLVSRALILMIFAALIIAFLTLGFILSYLLPKLRKEI
ncbi:MAG: hypothetical protein QXV74_04320 [Candidatus Bathyarchaeia archaeon]